MISLDQVLLLQKKVETAVEKIAFLQGQVEQLTSDNDALRTKCSELTRALDEKAELVSSLETNQGKIEEGILNALNRLDTVENSILSGVSGDSSNGIPSDEPVQEDASYGEPQQEAVAAPPAPEQEPVQEGAQNNSDSLNGQFDIF